jgi:hypothetical protein
MKYEIVNNEHHDWAAGWTTGVRFSAGKGFFSLDHHIQTG